MRRLCVLVAVLSIWVAGPRGQQRPPSSRLFPPQDLGVLESPDRDDWQQPDAVMDALGIADGAKVADIGAGGGWFTIHLANRVGPNGVVYAEDIQPQMIALIAHRAADHGLKNVNTILGDPNDPHLPARLQAVLMVDTYPQLRDPVNLLQHVAAALAPDGRLGIVDFKKDGAGGPGPPLDQRVDPEIVRRDADLAGLTFLADHSFLRFQYLLVFKRAPVPQP